MIGAVRSGVLSAAAGATMAAWLAFMLKAPALQWIERPLPFGDIHRAARTVGPITDTMAILFVLLVAYFAMVWAAQTRSDDLPAPLVLITSAVAGLFALLTYALFAEDVNVLLANVWTFAVGGLNPYAVAPNAVPANPFRSFTGWGNLEYVYGPLWLAVNGAVMKVLGPGVLINVLAAKLTMLLVLWSMGLLAWHVARSRGSSKPMATAALVLWNPLLLIEGVMTPHVDIAMAAAMVAALLAWARRREDAAIFFLALSVAAKFITALLAPALGFALVASGALRRPAALVAVASAAVSFAVLWPTVWDPFMRHGLKGSLDIATNMALVPNVVTASQALGLLSTGAVGDPMGLAKTLRWPLFAPIWLAATALCGVIAIKHRFDLPHPLFEPFALMLLAYHLLFTVWVLPWHFTTALALCLLAPSRWGVAAGLLVTLSGVLTYFNQWVWAHSWPDPRWIGWVLAASLLSGPLLAVPLLVRASWDQLRTTVRSPGASPSF